MFLPTCTQHSVGGVAATAKTRGWERETFSVTRWKPPRSPPTASSIVSRHHQCGLCKGASRADAAGARQHSCAVRRPAGSCHSPGTGTTAPFGAGELCILAKTRLAQRNVLHLAPRADARRVSAFPAFPLLLWYLPVVSSRRNSFDCALTASVLHLSCPRAGARERVATRAPRRGLRRETRPRSSSSSTVQTSTLLTIARCGQHLRVATWTLCSSSSSTAPTYMLMTMGRYGGPLHSAT